MSRKLEAIKRINNGESLKKIALEFGVGETTVGDWRRNKAQIEAFCSKMDSSKALEGRSTLKKAKTEKLDEAVYLWFKQQRAQGIPISGNILKEKALLLSQKLNENESFSASQGWLDKFKKRHGIRQLAIAGEKLSANIESAKDFVERFEEMIEKENLTLDQIYNADETGLFYRMMPSKTLASKEEASAPGYKKSKDRVSLLVCANASGTDKLPLLLIGKSKKPRPFKNINVNSLPVKYTNQRSAWMNSEIFEKWFYDDFVPHVKEHLAQLNLPPKAVLLIDNAPCHPEEEMLISGEIRAILLPPNVTSIIQPMDQGVIETTKRHYKKKLITHILECEENLNEALKKINVKDVIYKVAQAWQLVNPATIRKSFNKIIVEKRRQGESQQTENTPTDGELLEIINGIEGCEEVLEEDICEWLDVENQHPNFEILNDEEIIQAVNPSSDINDAENEDEDFEDSTTISHSEGVQALTTALKYLEQRNDATPMDLLLLKNWRDRAAHDRNSGLLQRKVTHFFKRM